MVPDIIIACFITFLIGMVVGCIIYYNVGEPKCNHQFEEILNTVTRNGSKDVVVYMCKKCGKRKITKV